MYVILLETTFLPKTKSPPAFFLEFTDIVRPALNKIPVYVTGGFQTAAGMVKAIKDGSTDGIGSGRPSYKEPYLTKQIINGEVYAKVGSKMDYDDIELWLGFAGSNIRRLGFGMETIDSTDERIVQDYLKESQTFRGVLNEKLSEGIIISGHPRFGTPALPWENY